jgi:transcriptional regulator with XRE-family HTH domain
VPEEEKDPIIEIIQSFRAGDPEIAAPPTAKELVAAYALELRTRREALGITEEGVAEKLGIPANRIGEYEWAPGKLSVLKANKYANLLKGQIGLVGEESGSAKKLGQRLRTMRQELGLTQTDVGKRMEVPAARIAEIEGSPDRVSLAHLLQCAAILGGKIGLIV